MTSTTPFPGGEVAVMEVSEFTTTFVAAPAPNWTEVAPVKPWPLMSTTVLPDVGPRSGETAFTTGVVGSRYVYSSAQVIVDTPLGVVTTRSTVVLAVPRGACTVRDRPLGSTTTCLPGVAPKSTDCTATKLVPSMVTVLCPASGPAVGTTPVTLGG